MFMRTQFASLWFVLCLFATVHGLTIRKSLAPESFLEMKVIDMQMLNVSCPQTSLTEKWDCLAEIVGADMKLFIALREDSRYCPGLQGWLKWSCLARLAGAKFKRRFGGVHRKVASMMKKLKAKATPFVNKLKDKAKGLVSGLKKKKETVKAKVSEKKASLKTKVANKKAKIKNKVKRKRKPKVNADVDLALPEPKKSSVIKNIAKVGAVAQAAQVVRSRMPATGYPVEQFHPVEQFSNENNARGGGGRFRERFRKGRFSGGIVKGRRNSKKVGDKIAKNGASGVVTSKAAVSPNPKTARSH